MIEEGEIGGSARRDESITKDSARRRRVVIGIDHTVDNARWGGGGGSGALINTHHLVEIQRWPCDL